MVWEMDEHSEAGVTDGFKVVVGLHKGSAMSPFLCAVVIDGLTDEISQKSLWTMMYDVVREGCKLNMAYREE